MNQGWSVSMLGEVAPAQPAEFPPVDQIVWNLSLEDVESGSGRVLQEVQTLVANLGSAKTSFDTCHVLYSKLRPYLNKVVVPDKAGVGTSELIPLCPVPSLLDREFLAFYLRSPAFVDFATRHMQGANLPRVSMREFWKQPIPLPSLAEQRRIVERIKECLSRIDEIKRLREESRREADVIEGAAFADFLVEASTSSWPVVHLGDLLLKSQYGTSQKALANGQGYPVLRMGNLRGGHLDFNDLKYIDLSPGERKKYRLDEGDILINRTNSLELVGKSAVFGQPDGDWVFASYLIRLVADRSKALPEFVNAVINSKVGRSYVYATARRAIGMVNINAQEIAKMPLPLPPIKKQEEIVSRLREARRAAQALIGNLGLEAIEALQSSVLRKAFAGEL